jgi:hypothetical protein
MPLRVKQLVRKLLQQECGVEISRGLSEEVGNSVDLGLHCFFRNALFSADLDQPLDPATQLTKSVVLSVRRQECPDQLVNH